jgi:transcription elongation factor Elf1
VGSGKPNAKVGGVNTNVKIMGDIKHRIKSAKGKQFCQFCGREDISFSTCVVDENFKHNYVVLNGKIVCNRCGHESVDKDGVYDGLTTCVR